MFKEYFKNRPNLDHYRYQIEKALGSDGARGAVLEIGSGQGQLQGIGNPYVALDYSHYSVSNFIEKDHVRACADAAKMPFADGTFSGLFSLTCLEHVPDARSAFAEIDRILAPGGIAFLLPAWHCVQYNCEGIPVRPYSDLTIRQKLIKISLPLLRSRPYKAMMTLPGRILRRGLWTIRKRPTQLRFKTLTPDYVNRWCSDSDAIARIDSHEGCLFFHSRGYEIRNPGRAIANHLFAGHDALIVVKPDAAT